MTFPEPILDSLRSEPEAIVVEHGDRTVTRAELLRMVGKISGGLRDAGLGPGRGVAMELDVSAESLAAYLAGYATGSRVVGVRPGLSAAQRSHILGAVDKVLTDDVVAELLRRPGDEPVTVAARPDDVARLIYTSGSTGRPKGCATSYQALSRHWVHGGDWVKRTTELASRTERYLLFGTIASGVVQDHLALSLMNGGTAVIPELDGTPLFPYVIERLRISASIMNVPRLYQMLAVLREEKVDTSTLRALVVSGSPLVPHRLAEAVERLGTIFFQTYGQSETGRIAMLTPDDIDAGVLDAVGRPYDGVDVEIRDGEIYARTPYQMHGYWQEPEQTAEVLKDGWVRTRDLGHLDDQGYLHVTGRVRDVIIVDAMPVYAGPIEQVLTSLPDVDQAYVVGTPDDRRGEAVHAFVVPRGGRPEPDRDALIRAVRDALGELSVPQTIEFVPEAPMAPSGKPDKRALLALYPRP